MLCFLDESGTHSGSSSVCVAGYLISETALPPLEQAWSAKLKDFGLEELHMREFVPPHGSLSAWPEDRKRALIEESIELIHRHCLIGVGAALEMTELMRFGHATQAREAPYLVDTPYEWCFRYCAVQAAQWADESATEGLIDFVVDAGCTERGRVYQNFADARKQPDLVKRFRLGRFRFGESTQEVALQCADLLAYEMFKDADRRIRQLPRGRRGSFRALLREHDRLITIDEEGPKRQALRSAAFHWAIVNHLPPVERFKVLCWALRHMRPGARETLLEHVVPMREVWSLCLASNEQGMRLDEVPRELLPPDDPEWFGAHGMTSEDVDLAEVEGAGKQNE